MMGIVVEIVVAVQREDRDEALRLLREGMAFMQEMANDLSEAPKMLGFFLSMIERDEYTLPPNLVQAVDDIRSVQPFENGVTAGDAAESVLQHIGKPSKAKEIVESVLSRGYNSKAGRPDIVIGNALRTDDRFVKLGRGVFGLNEWAQQKKEGES